ncbi:phosphate signaling complex PhoU family protein [Methanobacterium alcaliphilum]|uniref:phosphate signaling complex PhoU family protein n=1 Tax=Methanobacterium alcaliphilum TaxID=392018 RepID=UPI00200A552B|nr:PhoU domain-containing protein [Methanobacterium alcaliphilum]MCK9152166.1 winged helix-turn-helix transcriptional regulator [Methanobacterium alcaliphilum]
MNKKTKNTTLKSILDIILYENPATQDEIADKLGITRRYVTKLLQPMVKKGVVRRAYIVDLQKFDEFSEMFEEERTSREYAGSFFIKEMLKDMAEHVCQQLEMSFNSLSENSEEMANEALKMDYTTNKMHEKVRSSVDTAIAINPYSEFSKTMVFSEIAYDLERIGDHSGIIANFIIKESYEIDAEMMKYLESMYQTSRKMVKWSMEAFITEKLELKNEVMDYEEKIHQIQKKALNCIATQMAETTFEDVDRSTYYISLSRVVKAFERVGDISMEIVDTAAEYYRNIPRTTTPERFRREQSP